MARKRAGRDVHGIILLDKPAGQTSNRALQEVRRLMQARKAGHTGSLDPFATGMLPICLGEATKTAGFMLDADKTYRATACLGQSTATGDPEGATTERLPVPLLDAHSLETALARFRGSITQIPPMHSALKHGGQPLYRLARQGIEIERRPRPVVIHRLELIEWNSPLQTFEVSCSKGTYVRTLAEDICGELGTCGHLVALRRLAVSPFEASRMITIETLRAAVGAGRAEDLLLAPDAGLSRWPVVCLAQADQACFRHGRPVRADAEVGPVRVHGPENRVIGLGEVRADGLLYPRRVFVYNAENRGNA